MNLQEVSGSMAFLLKINICSQGIFHKLSGIKYITLLTFNLKDKQIRRKPQTETEMKEVF